MSNSFFEVLAAKGPHPTLGVHAKTYGRLIGSWEGQLHNHMAGTPVPTASIEIHFAWALDGRAVQDVWITPARKDRGSSGAASMDWWGTTLRVFDPKSGCWRATWTDPVSGYRIDLEGSRQHDDIVQLGTRGNRLIRWTFSDIHADSFLWQGHVLESDGMTWRLEVEIRARRV